MLRMEQVHVIRHKHYNEDQSVRRIAHECAKLDPKAEQAWAEEGMSKEFASWPEY